MTKALHIAAMPAHALADLFHRFRHTHTHVGKIRVATGTGLILLGGFMAHHPWSAIPLFLWDSLAYFIHGCGAAPILVHLTPLVPALLSDPKESFS